MKTTLISLMTCFLFACTQTGEKRPNIIVMLTDDQRPATLTCYDEDSPIETPNIDRLATSGILFNNGFVTTPICCVSRASIITGRYAANHRMHNFNTPIDDSIFADSYPAHLKNAGYFTGALGKHGVGVTQLVRESYDVFEAQAGQGPAFRDYQGKKMHDAEWLTVKTFEFLDQVPEDQPFCLQVNYKEPHGTSVPAPEDDDLLENFFFERVAMDSEEEFKKVPLRVQQGLSRWAYDNEYNKDGDINWFMRMYHEKIVSVERSVGIIMKGLEERGLAENTVILFLSDHGYHYGEKQLSGKWTPYDESLRIPFIVYDPRNKNHKGEVLDEMVLNIDLAPTILELAGLEVPATMDGRSMLPLMQGKEESWRTVFFFEHYCSPPPIPVYLPRHEGIRTGTEKYVRWVDMGNVVEEYFHLDNDPLEAKNLVGDPEYASGLKAISKSFDQWRDENPVNYEHKPDGLPHFDSKDIDWAYFAEKLPEKYARIKAEIDRLGVTWQQAEDDWEIRYEIGLKAEYWY